MRNSRWTELFILNSFVFCDKAMDGVCAHEMCKLRNMMCWMTSAGIWIIILFCFYAMHAYCYQRQLLLHQGRFRRRKATFRYFFFSSANIRSENYISIAKPSMVGTFSHQSISSLREYVLNVSFNFISRLLLCLGNYVIFFGCKLSGNCFFHHTKSETKKKEEEIVKR